MDDEWSSCFLNYYTAKSMEKGDWMCCQKCNVWNREICVGEKGKRQFFCGRCHWSELYHQVIGIVPTEVHFRSIVRSFLFFLCNYNIKHFHMKKIWHIHQATQNMFRHWYFMLFYVFYTLKHVLSEMIEIVPPYHICYWISAWIKIISDGQTGGR
jgi:hypothetical protein